MRKTNPMLSSVSPVHLHVYNLSYVNCSEDKTTDDDDDDDAEVPYSYAVRKWEQNTSSNDMKNVLIWRDSLISIIQLVRSFSFALRRMVATIQRNWFTKRNEWKCTFSIWKSGTSHHLCVSLTYNHDGIIVSDAAPQIRLFSFLSFLFFAMKR